MEEKEEVRLNKFLSDAGVCSRREADRLIEAGRVTVDGTSAVMGLKVTDSRTVAVDGKAVKRGQEEILLAFYKPVGVVCTTSRKDPDNIIDYVNYPKRIYPIGRLDKDSEGLLLLTNRGDIVDRILRGSNFHDKEYVVQVNKPLTGEFLASMRNGVPILDTVTRPCTVRQTGSDTFHIILTQGLNRQIRRMCEYLDYRVIFLKRIRIMNINLGNLKRGTLRGVEQEERNRLFEIIGMETERKDRI